MSLETISTKNNRVYQRRFDHDEAQELRAQGWSYPLLADRFGVSVAAVYRICNPEFEERQRKRHAAWLRKKRHPCSGGCGRLVWMHGTTRSGYCPRCVKALDVAADVRESELRCTKCRRWKPDEEFPRYKGVHARRGRNGWCRSCCAAARREHRRLRPDIEQAAIARKRSPLKKPTSKISS